MTTTTYSLDEFVSDMESLLKDQRDQQKIFDRGSSHLSRLIGNPDSIPAEYRVPVGKGSRANHGSYLLYHGESGLSVTAVVWGPGDHASPHDHRTWGMIGVMDNALKRDPFPSGGRPDQGEFCSVGAGSYRSGEAGGDLPADS